MPKRVKLRLENGLKRSELARLTGIHQNTIANYENGVSAAPYDTLIIFANFFDVTLDELLGREKSVQPAELASPLTSHEKKFIAKYRKLSAKNQKRVDDFLEIAQELPD